MSRGHLPHVPNGRDRPQGRDPEVTRHWWRSLLEGGGWVLSFAGLLLGSSATGPRLLLGGLGLLTIHFTLSPPRRRLTWLAKQWSRLPDGVAFPLALGVPWALAVRAVAILGALWLPPADGVAIGRGDLLLLPLCQRWDAAWYQSIAFDGYFFGLGESSAAFFPLYPLLVRGASLLLRDRCASALFVAHVGMLLALAGVYDLARTQAQEQAAPPESAKVALLLLVAWPFAFFLVTAYPESTFLACAAWAFAFARRRRFVLAAVLGAAAAATRLTGLLLLPALWLVRPGTYAGSAPGPGAPPSMWSSFRARLPLVFIPSGTLGFFLYLQLRFDDFWANPHAASWGWGRGLRKAGHELFAAAAAAADPTATPSRLLYTIYLVLALTLIPFLPRLFAAQGAAATVWVMGLALAGLLTGLEAFGRYLVPAFPLALMLAPPLVARPLRLAGVLLVAGLLQALFLLLHAQGYWVT